MTFPCKEEFILFEQLEKRQVRIYPDACDYGVRIRDIAPAHLIQLRQALNEMVKLFKNSRGYKASNWSNGRSVEMFIPVEHDMGGTVGYKFCVSFNDDPAGGFITVDIERDFQWSM